MDPTSFKYIYEFSPALAVGVFIVLLVVVTLLKLFGFAGIIGDKAKVVDDKKMNAVSGGVDVIQAQLQEIERRLVTVEHKVEDRPTRQEIHSIDLSIERLNGRMGSFETELKATRATASRIEDFLLAISERSMRETSRRSRGQET